MFKRKEKFNFAFPLPGGGEAHVETLCDKDSRQLMELMLTSIDGFRQLWLDEAGRLGKLCVEHDQAIGAVRELEQIVAELRERNDELCLKLRYAEEDKQARDRVIEFMKLCAERERGKPGPQPAATEQATPANATVPGLSTSIGLSTRDAGSGCQIPGTQPCPEYRVSGKNAVELAKILDKIAAVYGSGTTKLPGANELYIQFHEAAKKFGVPYSAYEFDRKGAEFVFTEPCDPCAVPC